MAAASKKNSTKENIEVKDNNKNSESVFDSNVKQKRKTGNNNAKKTGNTKSPVSKTISKKRDSAKINITHQRKIQDVTEYRDRLAFETGLTLIVIGIVAVFLYISFLGLGGMVGRFFGGICFGIFGWVSWVIPIGMLFAYIFTVVNKGDRRVKRKMTGIIGAFICLAAITDLISEKEVITEYYTSNHVLHHGYFECMNLTLEDVLQSGKSSGGLIGRWISSLLTKICGNVGACILLFALLILCLFIFEGIEIMAALRKRNAYREEMERLYGEVKKEIGYKEPSYTVIRNKSSINPFGNVKKKDDEVDIREKYRRMDEASQKNSGGMDYVEAVRQNTSGVMQSVDLKMMAKFLDEQKKNRNHTTEKSKTEEKKDNKPIEEIKPDGKTEKKSEFKINRNTEKRVSSETGRDFEKKPEPKVNESKEPIPIFREEMNQKFGKNRGKVSTSSFDDGKKNVLKKQAQHQEEQQPEKYKEDDYEPEIEIDSNFKEDKTEKKGAQEAEEKIEKIEEAENIGDDEIEDIAAAAETLDTMVENDEIAVEDCDIVVENAPVYSDTSVEDTENNNNNDIDVVDEGKNIHNTCQISEISYKKPENKNKHGKFGGDDYVSASESFNALNESKVSQEPVIERAHVFPPVELLGEAVHNNDSISDDELRETAQKLQDTLQSFNVNVKMGAVICGPTVTRYELQPEQGVRVNKITNLTDDIKLSLAAQSIRIEAPIPGKSAVGIEVPNPTPSSVYFRELLESEAFKKSKSPLTFAVGKDIAGKTILTDIGKMPHLLIAGATGSGKSVCINTLIMSILYKSDPNDVKLIMIDPKVVELSVYNGIPHLMCPVVTDPKDAAATLNWAVREMSDRYNKFTELGARNIAGYNEKLEKVSEPEKAGHTKMPYIVVIVDEFADLMMVASKDVEDAVCRLAQLARAAGIHLVLATQRPSVNVITGTIKANIPSRIAFSVSSAIDSRTIIDKSGAEKLLGKGDMLFFPSGYSEPIRVQGAFVTDEEVGRIVDFLKNNNEEPEYNDKVTQVVEEEVKEPEKDSKPERDEYFEEAGRYVIEADRAAAGQLQRRFSIGFNRAGRIIDQLHKEGVVGPAEGTKPRKILMSKNEFEMMLGNAPEPVSEEEINAITEEFGQQ